MPTFESDRDPAEYLRDCVRIEPIALHEEFIRMPADYAYWNEQYRQKLEAHLLCAAERKRVYAGCLLAAGERINASTGKPVTVDQAKAIAETDRSYQLCVTDDIHAEADMIEARGILEAIRTKRDMLMQLGATARQEMQHDPAVRERSRAQRGE